MSPDHNPRALDCGCASCRPVLSKCASHGVGDCPKCGAYLMIDRPRGYNIDKPTESVNADGSTQLVTAVLAERAQLFKLKGRKRMDAAHRLRAGMIGVLQSCLCDYPLETYPTSSGHDASVCPAHRVFEACARAKASDGQE